MALLAAAMALAAGSGCQGSEGRQGPPGAGTSPSISAVTPWQAFPARTVEVMISGNGTQFAAGTSADFGAGVAVSSVRVVSPTELLCTLTVAADAAMGPRDVTVTGGGASLLAAGGFEIVPSLGIWTSDAPILQGDIFQASLFSLDDQPLWPISGALAGESSGLWVLNSQMVNGVEDSLGLVDVFADPGPRPLSWTNPGMAGRTFVADPAVLTVGARSPVALGVPSTTSVVFDTRSKLFSLSMNQLGILSVRASAVGSALSWPIGLLLPDSGQVAFMRDFQPLSRYGLASMTDANPRTFYVSVTGGGAVGTDADHTLTLDVALTPVASITAESGGTHDLSAPQAVAPPAIVEGALATGTEVDAYAITVPSGSSLEVTAAVGAYVTLGFSSPGGSLGTFPGYGGGYSFTFKNAGASGTYKVSVTGEGTACGYALSFRVY